MVGSSFHNRHQLVAASILLEPIKRKLDESAASTISPPIVAERFNRISRENVTYGLTSGPTGKQSDAHACKSKAA
jgi:hypothetical protein